MVDVPVVAVARLERHVVDGQAIVGARERPEVALSDDVPGKGIVLLAKAKETTVSRGLCLVIGVDLPGHVEGCLGVGPVGVEKYAHTH